MEESGPRKKVNKKVNELTTFPIPFALSEIKTNIVEQLLYFLQKLHINDDNNQDYKHTVLYGPPGTGKTLSAKAIAKESGATFIEINCSIRVFT